jgi:hypothetical protein
MPPRFVPRFAKLFIVDRNRDKSDSSDEDESIDGDRVDRDV